MGTSIDGLDSKKKFRYFAILALLRGVMSSPDTGIEMLSRKAQKIEIIDNDGAELIVNPVADSDESESDAAPINLFDKIELKSSEAKLLKNVADRLTKVRDNKAKEAAAITIKWLKEGYNPIIFCRFISTAKYMGDYLKDKLPKNTDLLVITGEMVDEERKAKITELGESSNRRVLVATDCLSEGINLQQYFTAVLHYDLPWNPNRLEQREGRIDRYGQTAKEVKAYMLWGKDNPIDSVVLNVLLRKAKEIREMIRKELKLKL
jgi:superfamily II DNA/RNA helicase